MGKKYKNPPVVEALCEFQFIPTQPWDITIPGLLYERIRDEFPLKQQQIGIGFVIQPRAGGELEHNIELPPPQMQFFRSDKASLVQVGMDVLTINHLKPYPTWETFKPSILKILEKYKEIANPKGFRRIGLRYINKIDFNKPTFELTDYFNYYPSIPNNLRKMPEGLQVMVELPYEGGRDRLLLVLFTVIPEKPDVISLVLDLNYMMISPESIGLHQISDWLENAHTIVENAFEACITDKCRKLFEE